MKNKLIFTISQFACTITTRLKDSTGKLGIEKKL
jgi:hypothetical protein